MFFITWFCQGDTDKVSDFFYVILRAIVLSHLKTFCWHFHSLIELSVCGIMSKLENGEHKQKLTLCK